MKDFNYEQLANNLLDFMVEAHDLVDVCMVLLNMDYDSLDLDFLGFEEDTIKQALENIKGE